MIQANDMIRKPRDVGSLSKISMFMITVFLCFGLIVLSQGIKTHYVRELEVNAENLARGYSHSLSKTVEASTVVQQLIHDKLKGISAIIAGADNELQNEDLRQLSSQMDVDEIDVYDPQGVVVLSNVDEYMGWTPPMMHPMRDFIQSDLVYYVEPIRENTVTGEFYLYGYERMHDGRFVQ